MTCPRCEDVEFLIAADARENEIALRVSTNPTLPLVRQRDQLRRHLRRHARYDLIDRLIGMEYRT